MLLAVACLALLSLAAASPTSRVVNGIVATPHSYPAQLSLQLDGSHICGAVVVNSNFALTAAHCVDFSGYAPDRFRVVCGAHNIQDLSEPDKQYSTAAVIRKHESYDPNANGFPNDIALIKLATPLSLNDKCAAANLPPNESKDYANKLSTITGWGRIVGGGAVATRLKYAPINTISHSECRSRWGILFNPIRTTNICIYDSTGKHGACNGDSGGPLFSPDYTTGLTTVTGVTSFGRTGCDTSYPSVYTRISSYLGWINNALNTM